MMYRSGPDGRELANDPQIPVCDICGWELEWDPCDRCWGNGTEEPSADPDDWDDDAPCDTCSGTGGFWWCINVKSEAHLAARLAEEAQEARGE